MNPGFLESDAGLYHDYLRRGFPDRNSVDDYHEHWGT